MIEKIQKALNIPVTGEIDQFTEAAIRNFQIKNSLMPTGEVDGDTQELLLTDNTTGFISTDLREPVIEPSNTTEGKPTVPELVIKKSLISGKNNFFKGPTQKDSLFLHHTAGWNNPYNVIKDWMSDSRGEVCTHFVVGGKHCQTLDGKYDGEVVQSMEYSWYGWHLGIGNTSVHRNSIGIEVCNFGWLTKKGGDYYTWSNAKVSESEVVDLRRDFRGYRYFQKYTDKQLNSLKLLIEKIGKDQGIDITQGLKERLKKNKDPFVAFAYDQDIKNGKSKGLFCHTNVSAPNKWGGYDKWDLFPQNEVLDLILSL